MMVIERSVEKFTEFEETFWKYFLWIDREFYKLGNYIELDESNDGVYSVELLKLFMLICSEIDGLGKVLARMAGAENIDDSCNIRKWVYHVMSKYDVVRFEQMPSIGKEEAGCKINEFKVTFLSSRPIKPWENFESTETEVEDENGKKKKFYEWKDPDNMPSWWKEHNLVKHSRLEAGKDGRLNYSKANLRNVIYAFSALYVLELAYAGAVCVPEELSFNDSSHFFGDGGLVKPMSKKDFDKLFAR